MRHTLKRKNKNVTKTTDTSRNDTVVLNDGTSNDDKKTDEEKKPGRQSWGTEMPDFSHLPGTIRQFSKVHWCMCAYVIQILPQEQASIEEILSEHEEIVDVLTTRQDVRDDAFPSIK